MIRPSSETEEETETETEERGLTLADESNYLPGRSQVLSSSGQETDDDYSYAYRCPPIPPLLPSHAVLSPALQIQREAVEEESNIYEEIRKPGAVKQDDIEESDSDSTTNSENSFFLSISRGRRRHLQLHRFADWDLGSEEQVSHRRGVSFEIDTEQQQPKKMKLESAAVKSRIRSGDEGQKRLSSRERMENEKAGDAGLLEQVHRLGRRLSRKVSVAFGLRS